MQKCKDAKQAIAKRPLPALVCAKQASKMLLHTSPCMHPERPIPVPPQPQGQHQATQPTHQSPRHHPTHRCLLAMAMASLRAPSSGAAAAAVTARRLLAHAFRGSPQALPARGVAMTALAGRRAAPATSAPASPAAAAGPFWNHAAPILPRRGLASSPAAAATTSRDATATEQEQGQQRQQQRVSASSTAAAPAAASPGASSSSSIAPTNSSSNSAGGSSSTQQRPARRPRPAPIQLVSACVDWIARLAGWLAGSVALRFTTQPNPQPSTVTDGAGGGAHQGAAGGQSRGGRTPSPGRAARHPAT